MAELDYNVVQGQDMDWTLLDDTATDAPNCNSGEITPTVGFLRRILSIVVAHQDANDAASAYVYVSVLIQASANDNDEDWRHVSGSPFQSGGGQATAETLAANSGSGQANPERLEVADTTDWDTGQGEDLFLKDAGTLANSCLCKIEGWADNDYYINAWELENAYDSSDVLYNGVSFHTVEIPPGTEKYIVIFTNSDGDATYAVRVDFTEVTGIE